MTMHVYRRGGQPLPRVPVVLPQVDVDVDEEGRLTVRLNGEPYADVGLQRLDLQRLVTQIAADLNSPVRVDVREADGATFTDIVTPPNDEPENAAVDQSSAPPHVATTVGEISQYGFRPGDAVAVVVVVARVVADPTGTARFRLPPVLAGTHDVLLVSHPDDSTAVGVA